MKKFFTDFLLFTLVLPPGYLLLLIVWGELTPGFMQKNLNYRLGAYGHMHSRIAELHKGVEADILVLGSSHAYRGFDPRIFEEQGLTLFNLGSSAQTPIQTEILLNRYLTQISPRLVILEVYPETFAMDGVESALDIIANDPDDSHWGSMAITIQNLAVWHNVIYGKYSRFFQRDKYFVEPERKGMDRYVKGGFVEREMEKNLVIDKISNLDLQIVENQRKAFKRILKKLRERKIDYVLVQAPITKAKYQSLENLEAFNLWITSMGTHWNYNHILEMDDQLHFYDAHHLNQAGVEIFNRHIAEKILQFPLHHP